MDSCMSKTPPDLAGALEAMKAATRGPRKRSPVYTWLANRHDGLAEAFRSQPPSWKSLAKYLADGGVLNADGQPPTPAAVRTSWMRVEADLARKRASRGRSQTTTPPAPHQERIRAPVSIDDDETDDGPPLPDFSKTLKG